ncbi:hypothetical protein QFZ79_003963 [Arthrobacter sp. V4I6]|uniref:hypothetical protein n=1 Tax=Arthrobacter sp. V4I6 TaxID=3042281 RepID=UPI00277E824D|nr:hypothetical protein [Arthrobacter sp. V4I6]MDQ0821587.1 hypothetical protein [Arthrobacter sp. V1I7]MDQ0855852.1 hypothetical protein [Arthrobacter sp. V4I6]
MTPLPTSDLETLTPARHELYDEQGIGYRSELVIVQTSTARSIIHQGRLLTMLNQREVSARRGLVASGPWASGKTTRIKKLGKTHELRIRRRYPGQNRIPVVYITPSKGTPRKRASEFANFLDPPATQAQRHRHCRRRLPGPDRRADRSGHRRRNPQPESCHQRRRGHGRPPEVLRRTPTATFVYAGINVENSGLFTGLRGRQISARSVLKTTAPFPYGDEFRSLIATLEEALRLHDHAPGTLTRERPVSAPAHRRRNQQPLAPHPSGRHQRHPAPDRTHRPSATGRNRRRPYRRNGWTQPGSTDLTVSISGAVRPLPRSIRPHSDETTASFLQRLENSNALIPGQLRRTLRGRGEPWLNTLSAWSGHDPDVLSLAVPQLLGDGDHHIPDPILAGRPNRTILGIACRRYAQARSIGANIEIYTTHDKVICPRHGLWIGEGTNSCAAQIMPLPAWPCSWLQCWSAAPAGSGGPGWK